MANLDVGYTFNKHHRIGINHNYGDIKSNMPANGTRNAVYSPNDPSSPYSVYKKTTENTSLSYTGATVDKRFDWSAVYSFGKYKQEGNTIIGSPYWNKPVSDNRSFTAQAGYNGQMVSASVGVDHYKYD